MMRVACVVLIACTSACSFAFVTDVDGSARRNPQAPIACTASRALPATDLLIGTVLGGVAAGATYTAIESANDEDCPSCWSGTKPALLAAFLVTSPWWISSAVGFSDTGRCKAARRERRGQAAAVDGGS